MNEIQETLALPATKQPNPSPRPSRFDERIVEAAARALMPEIQRWAQDERDVFDEAAYVADIAAELESGEMDGFKLAYHLQQNGWECDAELVEILDGASSHLFSIHQKAVEEWVSANVITAEFSVGDIVSTPHGIGPICDIYHDTAQYLVQTPDFLSRRGPDAKGGTVVAFEQARLVEEEIA